MKKIGTQAPVPAGYRALHLWSWALLAVTATIIWLPRSTHIVVGLAGLTLLALHEILRPLCVTFLDFFELLGVASVAGGRAFMACLARGLRPRYPEWTIVFDCFQAVVSSVLTAKGQNIVCLPNAHVMRRNTEILGGLLGWVSCLQHGTNVHSFYHLGLRHLWVSASTKSAPQQDSASTRQIVVLYYHGGGYAVLCPRFYLDFCSRLVHQLRTQYQRDEAAPMVSFQVLLANYRKLPEYTFPAPMDDALAMYKYLITKCHVLPKNVIIAGDSAGAGLVLSTLRRLKQTGLELPMGAICASPMIDWPDSDDISSDCFVQPPLLTGVYDFCKISCRALDEVCSLKFDLQGFPPMLVQTGDKDLLYHQAQRLARKAQKDGVAVHFDAHTNMPHVFAALPPVFMPHANRGVANMAEFILKLLRK
jgi:acetyl esterase/lipase